MRIIVCMKQVPAGTKADIDPETGAMKRTGTDTRTNPYDLFALETALQIREKTGGNGPHHGPHAGGEHDAGCLRHGS